MALNGPKQSQTIPNSFNPNRFQMVLNGPKQDGSLQGIEAWVKLVIVSKPIFSRMLDSEKLAKAEKHNWPFLFLFKFVDL